MDPSGGCAYIGVQHYYDPVWSFNNFWTAWRGGGTEVAYYSPYTPEYIKYKIRSY